MVKSYIGTVEAQRRGTLHLHLLLWLMHAPSSAEMQRALTSDNFQSKIQGYIKAVIRADIHNFNTASILSHIPKESGISYSRPLDPRVIGEAALELQKNKLARAVQLHQCSSTTCLRMVADFSANAVLLSRYHLLNGLRNLGIGARKDFAHILTAGIPL